MSSPQARVIEAAVRTFSDNAELQLAATGLLAGASPSEEAIARWDAVDVKKRSPVRRWLPWVTLAVVSVLIFLTDLREMHVYYQWLKWGAKDPGRESSPPRSEGRASFHLDAPGKLLVFGDLASKDIVERKKKLWQSEPENPAYFSEYAAVFAMRFQQIPPDFLETARRIDPDNAWFTYFAAAMDMNRNGWRGESNGKLLREARAQTKYTSYEAELMRQRLLLLPQGNLMERFDSVGCLDNVTTSSKLNISIVDEVFSAVGRRAVAGGDVLAFQEIEKDADHFLRGLYQDEVSSLRGEEANARSVQELAQAFIRYAPELGLLEVAKKWEKIFQDTKKQTDARFTRKFTLDDSGVDSWKAIGSLFERRPEVKGMGSSLRALLPLTDADVKPGRLLDHEVLSRFFNYLCWLVMALCVGLAAAYRFRVSSLSWRLGGRMTELLRPADWAWMVGLGILLPFVYVMGINRLTPLGGREFGMRGTVLPMPACHFLGLLVLWLVVPVQIIRWRLATRAGGFGFFGPSLIGWVAVACAVAFVPWVGWIAISAWFDSVWDFFDLTLSERIGLSPITRLSQVYRPLLWVLGFPVLWLGGVAARALLGREDRHFQRAAAARVLVVSWAAALGVVCLASQGFKATQHYWFSRYELGRMDPARPALSVSEYRAAAQLRKEMLEILDFPTRE